MLLNIYIHGGDKGKGASFLNLLLQENEVGWLPLYEMLYTVGSTNRKTPVLAGGQCLVCSFTFLRHVLFQLEHVSNNIPKVRLF